MAGNPNKPRTLTELFEGERGVDPGADRAAIGRKESADPFLDQSGVRRRAEKALLVSHKPSFSSREDGAVRVSFAWTDTTYLFNDPSAPSHRDEGSRLVDFFFTAGNGLEEEALDLAFAVFLGEALRHGHCDREKAYEWILGYFKEKYVRIDQDMATERMGAETQGEEEEGAEIDDEREGDEVAAIFHFAETRTVELGEEFVRFVEEKIGESLLEKKDEDGEGEEDNDPGDIDS